MDEVLALQKENKRLQDVVDSMDKSARLLVSRDLELRRANVKLQSLDKQKSDFISIAAHQIRTPLTALKWSQQMLIDGDFGTLSQSQQEILDQSQQSVARLIKLVNNLLQVEHLELQQTPKESVLFDLNLLLKSCVTQFTAAAIECGVTIHFTPSSVPAVVLALPDAINDALVNLIDNAVKYTHRSGDVYIDVTVNDNVTITIRDTGIGIPDSYKDNAFKRFSRAENADILDANGSGLGLYIVKKVIESFSGSISYESDVGKGTTFRLSLRYAKELPTV